MKLEFLFTEELKNEFKELLKQTIKEEFESLNLPKEQNLVVTEFLSRKETSKLLGCSLTSLYHYQKKGLIPYHKVGRKILFQKSELVNHLKINVEK